MIFKKEHIKQIKNGIKTQTRRINRGVYQLDRDYAVQPCRTCKGIEGYRIVIDDFWEERIPDSVHPEPTISKEDALAEGGYTPEEFEKVYREIYPKPNIEGTRWVYKFHLGERISD